MRFAILVPLLFAGCDSGPQWENEQAELANDLNATAPPVEQSNNILADTDYINEAAPAANDVNAAAPDAVNEATPPPQE